jgi:class 3 adenylate cyclase
MWSGAPGEGERRHLSVMFCDLVDSTALGQRLDPEDLHEIIHTYQTRLNPAIEAYEGHVAQYLGDGLLVYFGYPTAHEDDAERSIRAGLAILDVMEALNPDRWAPAHLARMRLLAVPRRSRRALEPRHHGARASSCPTRAGSMASAARRAARWA